MLNIFQKDFMEPTIIIPELVQLAKLKESNSDLIYPEIIWKEPLKIKYEDGPEIDELDPSILPELIENIAVSASTAFNTPLVFTVVPILFCIGTLSAHNYHVVIKPDWKIPLNIYCALIGDPGSGKSPAVDYILGHLYSIQKEFYDYFERETHIRESELIALKASIAEEEKKLKAVIYLNNSADKDKINANIKGIKNLYSERIVRRKIFITNDVTPEKIAEIISVNPNGLGLIYDEIGQLLSLFRKKGFETLRGMILQGWSGSSSFDVQRIGRESKPIERLTTSLLCNGQPGLLVNFVGKTLSGGENADGFLQRLQALVWPPSRPPVKETPSVEKSEEFLNLLKNLAVMNSQETILLTLSPEAKSLFDEYKYQLNNTSYNNDLMSDALKAHMNKYPQLLGKICGIFHIAKAAKKVFTEVTTTTIPGYSYNKFDINNTISDDTMLQAIELVEHFKMHAEKLYKIETHENYRSAQALLNKILDGKVKDKVTTRCIYNNGWSCLDSDKRVEGAINFLSKFQIAQLQEVRKIPGGRASIVIRINPEVLNNPNLFKGQNQQNHQLKNNGLEDEINSANCGNSEMPCLE